MRKVTPVSQVHPHEGVARLEQGHVNDHVGLGAAMGLHVGMLGAEKLLGSFNGQAFDDVNELTSAVIATPRVAFRVLVGQDGARSLEHSCAREIF